MPDTQFEAATKSSEAQDSAAPRQPGSSWRVSALDCPLVSMLGLQRAWGLCFLLVCVLLWFYWNCNPLPKDEEMIANFQANRADFEEIVRRYREYPDLLYPSNGPFWYERGDTLELFKRAGIDDVKSIGFRPWLPNPYSVETALKVTRLVEQGSLNHTLWQKYGALILSPATTPLIEHPRQTDHRRHWRGSLRYGVIWKYYIFFPEIPRVENGTLFWALQTSYKGDPEGQYHEKEGVTTYQITRPVLPSLNTFPKNWDQYRCKCVYRQIEPQWFLCMCRSR